jgi:cholesterol transport system auxiliary component
MTAFRLLSRAAVAGICAALMSGCVSLVPKSKPAPLYRFDGVVAAQDAPAPAAGPRVGVFKSQGSFVRAAAGDRILTLSGDHAAYIADARWVAPAQVLFDEAVLRAFDANAAGVRLSSRGESGKTDYVLRLDVREFDVSYDQGAKAAPKVVVRLRAALTRNADRTVVGEQMFGADVRADENRVSSIAAAFDRAVGDVLGKVVDWTNQTSVAPPSA